MNIKNYYIEQGSGSPIVFIHGSYASTSTWKQMVEVLSTSNHCISIKLPGHCGTPDALDFEKPTLETELELIEKVVGQLTDEPVHLIGHSFGGVVALALALKGSINISQLSLFEPVSVSVLGGALNKNMMNSIKTFQGKYQKDVDNNVPGVGGQVIDFWSGEGSFSALPDFIKATMEPLVANNIRHWHCEKSFAWSQYQLKNITVPTRLICGQQSNPLARVICEYLQQNIPNSKTYVINGASHFLVTSHAHECLATLADWSFT